jgi:hypothetical protein
LLLTPTIDHLFDRGFISFEADGKLLVSPVAHGPSLERIGRGGGGADERRGVLGGAGKVSRVSSGAVFWRRAWGGRATTRKSTRTVSNCRLPGFSAAPII